MNELIVNLHLHTVYSDGSATHAAIARAALKSGIDVVIVTDHNVLVHGLEGYHQDGNRRLLMLVGEEVNDQARKPQKNHLLILGADRELAGYADSPQAVIDQAQLDGGLTFLAHPYDPAMPFVGQEDISWEDWGVHSFTGIELWNGFSELKAVAHSKLEAIFFAFFPHFIAHGPPPQALKKWDELLAKGNRVVAVGGSDAHALHERLGPIRRVLFPYEFHFQCINTHVLTPDVLGDDWMSEKRMLLNALKQGRAFIGYDLPAATRGFRFTCQGKDQTAFMGDEIRLGSSLTLQIRLPAPAECRLIRDGELVKAWRGREFCTHTIMQPGAYRVECYINYLGKRRGWIFSNPIYVR